MKTGPVVLAIVLVLPIQPVVAQDYLGSWLRAEDFGRQLERSQSDQEPSPAQARDSATLDREGRLTPASEVPMPPASQAERQQWMRRIKAEYDLRARSGGKASAERWLANVAQELRRREASAASESQH